MKWLVSMGKSITVKVKTIEKAVQLALFITELKLDEARVGSRAYTFTTSKMGVFMRQDNEGVLLIN